MIISAIVLASAIVILAAILIFVPGLSYKNMDIPLQGIENYNVQDKSVLCMTLAIHKEIFCTRSSCYYDYENDTIKWFVIEESSHSILLDFYDIHDLNDEYVSIFGIKVQKTPDYTAINSISFEDANPSKIQ